MPYKLVTLNVDSIVRDSRKTLLYDFLVESGGDIFFLQETKIDDTVRLFLPAFNVFRCDIRRGWGGSAILVRADIPVRNAFCIRAPIHVVFVECFLGAEWVRIASCYVPHGIADPRSAFESLFRDHPSTIFAGNFNSRHRSFGDVSPNCYGMALADVADRLRVQIVNPPLPTCFHSPEGSYIDKFLFSDIHLSFFSLSVSPSFSDHCAFSLSLPGTPPLPPAIEPRRIYHLLDGRRLNRLVSRDLRDLEIPNSSPIAEEDCESLACEIGAALSRAVDRTVSLNPLSRHKIVLSAATRALQRHAKSLQRRLYRSRGLLSEADRRRITCELSLTKNMIIGHVNAETSRFFSNTFDSVTTRRDAFSVVRRFTGHKSRPVMNGSVFTDETKSTMISGSANIADALARRFEGNHRLTFDTVSPMDSVAKSMADALRSNPLRISFSRLITSDILTRAHLHDIDALLPPTQRGILTSADEVAEIISKKPNKKSSGVDGIPYPILKSLNSDIILLLTSFFNHLLSISYFPRVWRHALVTPIPKPGMDSSLISNWRPISQLNCISKVFERLIARRIRPDDGANLFPDQYGFLPGHSAEPALARLQSDVLEGLNTKRVTTLVSLDLRAAFDTIWHDGLIMKLTQVGINPFVVRCIQSMLTERTFSVRLGGHMTPPVAMVAGVPQGSVLGPICFNYFMYDIPRSRDVNNLQFADDTTVYKTHNSPGAAQNVLNIHIGRLSRFFDHNKLALNAEKTKLLHILGMARDTNYRLRSATRNMKISVGGLLIRPSDDVRLLGVRFQTNNRFTRHMDVRLQKARALGII